ncbi:hypothetical protein, partial [Sphingopyxis sp. NFH-91]
STITMNPVATSDAAFRGGACPTPEYTIAYTGNYTTSADANVSGSDKQIDASIAELFEIEPAEFTSSAAESRRLSAQLLPHWQLRVGYDVCGIFPSATVSLGDRRHSSVAPTVPLAVLRALISAVVDQRSCE